jgi:hypothetical protein
MWVDPASNSRPLDQCKWLTIPAALPLTINISAVGCKVFCHKVCKVRQRRLTAHGLRTPMPNIHLVNEDGVLTGTSDTAFRRANVLDGQPCYAYPITYVNGLQPLPPGQRQRVTLTPIKSGSQGFTHMRDLAGPGKAAGALPR